jgi:modulator of FtsH protease HflC
MKYLPYLFGTLVILGYLLTCFYVVDVTEYAIETFFNQVIAVHREAGLSLKWPALIGQAIKVDRKMQVYNMPAREFLTRDKKNIIASAFVVWQVEEPVTYWRSLHNNNVYAESRLGDVLSSAMGAALGQVEFQALISHEAGQTQLDDVMGKVRERVRSVEESFGVKILDVRFKRLNFPDSNRLSVFRRMESERKRIATQFRSEGEEEATKLRAETDRQKEEILAEARRKAEELRGQGEAEAARVFAEAVAEDPDFYFFLRTLQAYERTLDGRTTLLLSADAPFLRLLYEGVELENR